MAYALEYDFPVRAEQISLDESPGEATLTLPPDRTAAILQIVGPALAAVSMTLLLPIWSSRSGPPIMFWSSLVLAPLCGFNAWIAWRRYRRGAHVPTVLRASNGILFLSTVHAFGEPVRQRELGRVRRIDVRRTLRDLLHPRQCRSELRFVLTSRRAYDQPIHSSDPLLARRIAVAFWRVLEPTATECSTDLASQASPRALNTLSR